MDPRFKKINRQLTEYALGNFEKKLKPSTQLDEVDAFISCINMLGEELKETTISKNHFNNIFNSVSDMIFVINAKGIVQNTSNSVHEILKYPATKFKNKFIDTLEVKRDHSLFKYIQINLKKSNQAVEIETSFKTSEKIIIPVICSASFLYNEKKIKTGYLIVAKNLTNIKAYEFSIKQSEEKYRKVFEESSDCIFIADKAGDFLDVNEAGNKLLKKKGASIVTFNLFNLIHKVKDKKYFRQEIKKNRKIENFATQIKCVDNSITDCIISTSAIENLNKKTKGYRGIIKDISKQKQTENIVLKTIAQTQESERMRFAKDIHDSIGQQLSAIKFYIGTSVAAIKDENQKKLLVKSNDALVKVLADMRNICFNLMPKTLENYGLVTSIKELCKQSELHGQLIFKLNATNDFPLLNKSLEIAIFRIVQEFINNTLKHSGGKKINIDLMANEKNAVILLKDNGVGFDFSKIASKGMGLNNVHSRVQPYNGDVLITSLPGKGTKFKISIPLTLPNIV